MVTRVIASRIPSALDAVLAVKEELLDRELILRGKFADEIARLEKARGDAEEKLGMIETVEQAAKIGADAELEAKRLLDEAGLAQGQAAEALASALLEQKALDEKERWVAAREAAFAETGARLAAAADALLKREQDFKAGEKAATLARDARDDSQAKRAAELTAKVALIAEREKRLNARLESLKLPPE